MPRSLLVVLTLIAGSLSSGAFAQMPDESLGATGTAESMPTLILPREYTNPITSGPGADDHAVAGPARDSETSGEPAEAPYSVEGEEPLDPDSN